MSKHKDLLSLKEFQLHSKIPCETLLDMLDQGLLPCQLTADGQLMIDLSAYSEEAMVEAHYTLAQVSLSTLPSPQEVCDILEPLLDEAVALAMSWLVKERKVS